MKNKIIKKSVNITSELEKRIEKVISNYPGLNFTLIVNQALEEWLRGSQRIDLSKREAFIHDNSKGHGPQSIV